jgi:hypothetical protein
MDYHDEPQAAKEVTQVESAIQELSRAIEEANTVIALIDAKTQKVQRPRLPIPETGGAQNESKKLEAPLATTIRDKAQNINDISRRLKLIASQIEL